jgi:phenylpropionate dioxygenase-like ring-hydroxylating dioxygenase large terminal subunit
MLTKERIDELVDMEKGRIDISLYTDEEIFEAELQRIFYTTWVFVAHESEIKEAGDYKTSYIGRIPVIVSRDENNEIHVLINRCAHRGPTVCQQEYGNANFFRCEYHGWVYGNDGSLAGVSLRRGFGPGEIDDIQGGLDKAEVGMYRGLIFARLTPGGPSVVEHLGLAKQYLDDWLDRSPLGQVEVTNGIWKHTYVGNWKLQLEGSNEGYHPDYLHKISRLVAEHVQLQGGKSPRPYQRGGGFGTSDSAGIDLGNGHSIMGSGGAAFNKNWKESYAPQYVADMIAAHGEERAAQILGIGWRLQLFPNAAFANNQIRIIRPISIDKTEILQYHVVLPGTSDAMKTAGVKGHQSFYGPAGYGSSDDIEMFGRMFEGYRSSDLKSLNQWALFSRGRQLETRGPNGERFGHTSTEVEQRAIYYAWAALMKGESHVINTGPVSGTATQQAALSVANRLGGGANQG